LLGQLPFDAHLYGENLHPFKAPDSPLIQENEMTSMTLSEKQQFLAGLHVGVLAIAEPGRGPLTVPVWYAYEPGGEVWLITGKTSRKGKLLTQGVRVSLVAQTEVPPYKYVSVEGPVTNISPATAERDTKPMAIRYLGEKQGTKYAADSSGDDESVVVRIKPEHWLAVDYSKQ
jgi:nitroimidazol reductase NimA-like FMN-containing flavoprotein (pyridoxamine 5'-phosphate oxidase superfamily)